MRHNIGHSTKEAGNAMNAFLTLTRAIRFITSFQQGANRVTVAGITTCAYIYLSGLKGLSNFDHPSWNYFRLNYPNVYQFISAVRQTTGVLQEVQVAMPVTVILLAPRQKNAMNFMALVNVMKVSEAGSVMNAFLTLTRAIRFITSFQQGANRVTVTGITTCIYLYLSGLKGLSKLDCSN